MAEQEFVEGTPDPGAGVLAAALLTDLVAAVVLGFLWNAGDGFHWGAFGAVVALGPFCYFAMALWHGLNE